MRVTITDPAALTVTSLDEKSKTAYVSHVNAATLNKTPILTPGSNGNTADGKPAGMTSTNPAGGAVATTSLGTKDISGVQAVGVRTVRTTPANNSADQPFVSTVDTWTSPELKVIVMSETRTSER